MLFTPKNYETIAQMMSASIMGAHSDTVIDGQEIFGFVDGIAYPCNYVFDQANEETFVIAAPIIL